MYSLSSNKIRKQLKHKSTFPKLTPVCVTSGWSIGCGLADVDCGAIEVASKEQSCAVFRNIEFRALLVFSSILELNLVGLLAEFVKYPGCYTESILVHTDCITIRMRLLFEET